MLHYYALLVIFQQLGKFQDSLDIPHTMLAHDHFLQQRLEKNQTIVDFVEVCGHQAPQNHMLCMQPAIYNCAKTHKERKAIIIDPGIVCYYYDTVWFVLLTRCITLLGTAKHILTLWKSRDIII